MRRTCTGWPNALYNDFNEGLRSSPDLRDLVRDAVDGLRRRGLCDWVDYDGLWKRHDRRTHDHADALIILASLELVLESREQAGLGLPS